MDSISSSYNTNPINEVSRASKFFELKNKFREVERKITELKEKGVAPSNEEMEALMNDIHDIAKELKREDVYYNLSNDELKELEMLFKTCIDDMTELSKLKDNIEYPSVDLPRGPKDLPPLDKPFGMK